MEGRKNSGSEAAPYRVIDLFAGCGGISEGFHRSGFFRPVAAVEVDRAAAATYAANFGEGHVFHGDIADWVGGDLPEADVVTGGPPCQGFSNLGSKREDDERNDLWQRYVDTLVKVRPKAFLMENVDRFFKTHQFQALLQELNSGNRLADYQIDAAVLRATDYGSAQLRKRTIVIGTRKDVDQIFLPRVQVAETGWRTVKNAIGDIEAAVPGDRVDLPKGREFEVFGKVLPGAYKAHELHITRRYIDLSRQRFEAIPEGGNRHDLPYELQARCWRGFRGGAGDVMGRLRWEKPSVTIRTEFWKPEKGRYLHPVEHRAITHYEAARIQGFPDTFKWCGTKAEIGRQIGNAVPVEMAEALARHIGEHLSA
ncbi:DNA cytosine methyltransferase [Streptomyces sp. NPDC055775]